MGGKRLWVDLGDPCEHPCAVPLCTPVEKQQLNPGHNSRPLPTPLAWCRDTHKNLQQIPPSSGDNCAIGGKDI